MSLSIVSSFNGVTDPDAGRYIAAVEQADGNQLLEFGVGKAINDFVVGCKQDRIWDAIKASCILAGARTLAGALVPLAGTAPTNVGPFVSGDYNRKTGLNGGTGKSLNSNRNNNVDPQDSKHISVYVTTKTTTLNQGYIGTDYGTGFSVINTQSSTNADGIINSTGSSVFVPNSVGFIGSNRSGANAQQARGGGVTNANTTASQIPRNANIVVFNGFPMRLAFYSIGESLDLALLDARVTSLINAFAVAIP